MSETGMEKRESSSLSWRRLMQELSGSVGKDSANSPGDVLIVQQLINQCIALIQPRAPLSENGQCDLLTIDAITDFQRRIVKLNSPDGRVDPGGRTLEALNVCASGKALPGTVTAPVTAPGKKYTDSPNEVPTKTTTPTAGDVVALVRQAWPELNEDGARTLAAQFMHETGGGRFCFNWNLGNVKSGPDNLHMYLRNVWEVDTPERAQAQVAGSGGLGHIATADEIKQHGWSCPAGMAVAVFDPPHPQSRFRAYVSLPDGAQRWVAHHQATAQKHPEFLAELNAGDCAAVAKTLKQVGYYTGGESDYANSMTAKKAAIDKELGAS
jgi:hypothetical protein